MVEEREDVIPGATPPGGSEPAAGRAQGAARETAGRAGEQASRMMDQARAQAETVAARQKVVAAEQVGDVASALRASARDLTEHHHESVASYVERAAAGLDELSGAIRERDLGSLLRDVEGFARRQPATFFGGALAAGFLLTRFLKSSPESHSDGDYSGSDEFHGMGTTPTEPFGTGDMGAMSGSPADDRPGRVM